MKWTEARCKELSKLHELLREVSVMNRGSGIIERIQLCEKIANALTKTNYNTGRSSFYQFLVSLAAEERGLKRERPQHGGPNDRP